MQESDITKKCVKMKNVYFLKGGKICTVVTDCSKNAITKARIKFLSCEVVGYCEVE